MGCLSFTLLINAFSSFSFLVVLLPVFPPLTAELPMPPPTLASSLPPPDNQGRQTTWIKKRVKSKLPLPLIDWSNQKLALWQPNGRPWRMDTTCGEWNLQLFCILLPLLPLTCLETYEPLPATPCTPSSWTWWNLEPGPIDHFISFGVDVMELCGCN